MKKIIVYHGTAFDFENIDLSKSKNKRDFGKGFYLFSGKIVQAEI